MRSSRVISATVLGLSVTVAAAYAQTDPCPAIPMANLADDQFGGLYEIFRVR
jgi:hypothetical protein